MASGGDFDGAAARPDTAVAAYPTAGLDDAMDPSSKAEE